MECHDILDSEQIECMCSRIDTLVSSPIQIDLKLTIGYFYPQAGIPAAPAPAPAAGQQQQTFQRLKVRDT